MKKRKDEINELTKRRIALTEDQIEKDSLAIQAENDIRQIEGDIAAIQQSRNEAYHNSIEASKQAIQSEIDYVGGRGTAQQYQELMALEEQNAIQYAREATVIQNKLSEIEDKDSDIYRQRQADLDEINQKIRDCEKNTKEWKKALLSLPFNTIDDQLKRIEKELNGVNDEVEFWDNIVAGAEAMIDDEIQLYQDQLDVLDKQNEARERALSLQKAEYDFERAKNQKTQKVYREGLGFVYESNQQSLRAAREALDSVQLENQRYQIQKNIDELNKSKEKWSEIAQEASDVLNIQKAMNVALGAYNDQGLAKAAILYGMLIDDIHLVERYNSLIANQSRLEKENKTWGDLKEAIQDIVDAFELGMDSSTAFIQVLSTIGQYRSLFGESIDWAKIFSSIFGDGDLVDIFTDLLELNDFTNLEELQQQLSELGKTVEGFNPEAINSFAEWLLNESPKVSDTTDDMKQSIVGELEDIVRGLDTVRQEFEQSAHAAGTSVDDILDHYDSLSSALISQLKTLAAHTGEISSDMYRSLVSVADGARRAISELQQLNATPVVTASVVSSRPKPVLDSIHHTGLQTGLVGKDSGAQSRDEKLKLMGLKPLSSDEVTSILRVGEAVLTKQQQRNVLHNIAMAYNAGSMNMSNIKPIGTGGHVVNVTFPGDMTFNQVQDIDKYFDEMAKKVKNVFIQQFS